VRFDEHNELKNIVIGDFDTAKRLSTTNKAKTIAGTVPYMAPEIILSTDDSNYSFPVDIWSFGMILYEITTLEAPFVNEDPMVIQERIIKKNIPDINLFFEKTNLIIEYHGIIELYESCTEMDPHMRRTVENLKNSIKILKKEFNNYLFFLIF